MITMVNISHDPLQVVSSPIHDLVSNKLSEMMSDSKADDKFIVCLHKLQQFYPQFADRYVMWCSNIRRIGPHPFLFGNL